MKNGTKLRTIEIYSMLVIDLLVALISYFAAHFMKYGRITFFYEPEMYTTFLLVVMIMVLFYTILINPSNAFTKRGYFVEFMSVTKYAVCEFVVMGTLLFMLKYAETFSRLMFGYFMICLEVLTYLAHIVLKKYIRHYYKSEKNQTKLLIITESDKLEEVKAHMSKKLDVIRGLVGYVIWDSKESDELGNYSNYKEKVKLLTIDEVFIYLPSLGRKEVSEIVEFFQMMGVVCNYGIDVANMYDNSGSIEELAGYTVISYSINSIDYNKQMIKRLFDILGGLVGSLITLVLTPFIALCIFIDDPGPVFFKQKRVGKNGRIFNIYKFRSMCKDAEKIKEKLMQENKMDGLMFKMDHDPRITKVGRFLRKTSLDEFPQFFNILAGDMSLIGTRPPTLDEYNQYDPHYKRRLSMKPGLTGMWQVSGRSDITDFDEVVKLDLEYIDNWSMTQDIKILLKTFAVVLTHKGAK